MATLYRLSDPDRERFGVPEWMSLDLSACTLDDVTDLSDRFGFELEDWPDVLFGAEGADGTRKRPKWALRAALWLALHQCGSVASWEDVGSVQILRVQSRVEGESGKGESSSDSPPSPTPETSTTPPSSTSSPDSPEPT